MRAWAFCLLHAAAGLRAAQQLQLAADPEDVAGLKTLVASLRKELKDLHKICDPLLPKEEPVSVEPEPAPKETKPKEPMSTEIGEPAKTAATTVYKPPQSGSGKPSDEKGWDYHEGGADWPSSFGDCGSSGQSPVALPYAVDIPGQTKGLLWFDYYADQRVSANSSVEFTNSGHGVFANLDTEHLNFGTLKRQHDKFAAYEVDFHSPSEHTIGGRHFPLEAQILNKDKDGKVIAISVMFEKSERSNKYLKALIDGSGGDLPRWSMDKAAGAVKISGDHLDAFNLENLLPYEDINSGRDLAFFNYEGSLTAPPCTGGVDWWVLAEPIGATEAEIMAVYNAIYGSKSSGKGNARKVHALDGRKVTVGHVGFAHSGLGHRQPGQVAFPKQPRGHNTLDHPWKPHEEAHWVKAATAPSDPKTKPGKVWDIKTDAKIHPSHPGVPKF